MLFDGDLRVLFYESLVDQTVCLIKLFQHALQNLFHGLRWFTFQTIRLRSNFPFFGNDLWRDLLTGYGVRMTGSDLQGDVPDELFEFVLGDSRLFPSSHL